MPGSISRAISIAVRWSCKLALVLTAVPGAAVSLQLSAPTTPPDGIAGLSIGLTDVSDNPVALVIHLDFDTSQAEVLDVSRGPSAGDYLIDHGLRGDGLSIVVYGGTTPMESGTLATVYLKLPADLPAGSTLVFSGETSTAANSAGEALFVAFPDATLSVEPLESPHHADTNRNGRMELNEVLRVVQLFRLSPIYCDATSEDGYSATEGSRDCAPHQLDYAPQDWRIGLSELLRCVQFFNAFANTYHVDQTSEDGFAPGPAED